MIKCGFFNAVNGAPSYDADDVNRFFEGLVSNGVYKQYGDAFGVSAGDGMSVDIGKGKASLLYHYIVSDSIVNKVITPSHVTYNRYTLIVLRYDAASKDITIETIDGELATNAEYPALKKNDDIFELALAAVYVPAGTTSINSNNITDLRSNVNMCGWATLTSALHINTYIQQKQANYTTTTTEQYLDLPAGVDDYEIGDVLQVFVNGVLYVENIDYTIMLNEVTQKYMIKGTTHLTAGNVVTFIVMKSKIADITL